MEIGTFHTNKQVSYYYYMGQKIFKCCCEGGDDQPIVRIQDNKINCCLSGGDGDMQLDAGPECNDSNVLALDTIDEEKEDTPIM